MLLHHHQEIEVVFVPEATGLRSIVDAVESQSSGKFKVHVWNPYSRTVSDDAREASKMFHLFISSLILSVPVFLIRLPYINCFVNKNLGPFIISDLLKWVLVSIVQFVIGKRFYVAAYRALRNGSTNMDVLVALGTSASYFYSVCALLYGAITGFSSPTYFETSSMLITFVLFGKCLEVVAKGKTSDAIKEE
ncbi:uncharacterized protein A4U43_C04F6840 [Asparagus officinalis]|uniref:Uncharacterized protein n=1 Tax=Asparagus officinalis TaxID=4686 RepID=A0A5P1F3A1_ASPOF|nr:copper-transporting ATPase RAN1-like isoform X2 [Asparagus officinalis]ONK71279.1 uncharacterized protein A4U43_C04F6840 [Asparagus officinalis]